MRWVLAVTFLNNHHQGFLSVWSPPVWLSDLVWWLQKSYSSLFFFHRSHLHKMLASAQSMKWWWMSPKLPEINFQISHLWIAQNDHLCTLIAVANHHRKVQQESRTKSIHWRLWQLLHSPCVTLEHSLQSAGISCVLVFAEGGKPENAEKNP